jgi:hypothetical protein
MPEDIEQLIIRIAQVEDLAEFMNYVCEIR